MITYTRSKVQAVKDHPVLIAIHAANYVKVANTADDVLFYGKDADISKDRHEGSLKAGETQKFLESLYIRSAGSTSVEYTHQYGTPTTFEVRNELQAQIDRLEKRLKALEAK